MIVLFVLLAAVPPDVTAFVERHTNCIHWIGQEPEDAERAREIEREVKSLACDQLDHDEAQLRRRYVTQVDVTAQLDALRTLD